MATMKSRKAMALKAIKSLPKTTKSPDKTDESNPKTLDSLEYLLQVMADCKIDTSLRVRAAIAAAQYQHLKSGDGGLKDKRVKAAEKVAKGKFAPAMPPRLVVNNK